MKQWNLRGGDGEGKCLPREGIRISYYPYEWDRKWSGKNKVGIKTFAPWSIAISIRKSVYLPAVPSSQNSDKT